MSSRLVGHEAPLKGSCRCMIPSIFGHEPLKDTGRQTYQKIPPDEAPKDKERPTCT